MKPLRLFLLLCPIAVLLAGCPVGLSFPAGDMGDEKLDKKLLGTWQCQVDSAEVLRVSFAPLEGEPSLYRVEVLESGEMYIPEQKSFHAWIAVVDGQRFIVAQPIDQFPAEYYHYHYFFNGKDLVVEDVGLMVGGIDAVSSTETLRQEISASMQVEGCFSSRFTYRKE